MKLLSSLSLSSLLLSSLVGTASGSCVKAAEFVPDDSTGKYCPPEGERYKADCCPHCGETDMCVQEAFTPPDVTPLMMCPEEEPEDGPCAVHSTVQTGELQCGYDKFCGPTTMGTMRRRAAEGDREDCMFIMTKTCNEDGAWVTEKDTAPEGYKSCAEVCARRRSRRLLFASRSPPPDEEKSVAELCGC